MDDDLLKDYQEFVDEVSSDATKNIDDFGDAHAEDGFCNSIRKAKVKGHVEESIFVVSTFELLSNDTSLEL